MRFKLITTLLCALFASSSIAAIFNVTAKVGAVTKTFGYSSAEDVVDTLNESFLKATFPGYLTDQIDINIDFRGLPVYFDSSNGSNSITLSIPDIGLNKTFAGANREASKELLKDWFKGEGGSTLDAMLKKLVEVSPHDPLAGNPNSLMANMVSGDFDRGINGNSSRAETGINTNLISIGLKASSFDQDGIEGRSLTVPLQYIIKIDSNPGHQIIFDLPLTYYQLDDAQTYSAKGGLGYRYPVTKNWSLTPSIGTGVVGSIDLGSVGQLISGAITSNYNRKVGTFRLGMGNMYGRYKTIKIKIGDIESNPEITNDVIRNAFFASYVHPLFGSKVETEVFLYDTRYFGDKLYMDQYNEIGLSLGTDRDRKDAKRLLRIGASYLFSPKTKGYTVNFGYSF